jgi:hypothetical protein
MKKKSRFSVVGYGCFYINIHVFTSVYSRASLLLTHSYSKI